MHRFSKPAALLALLALLLTFSGCYSGNIDQYFSLPQPSEEYRQLQALIDREIASGSEYAAPTRGSFRQSVQFSDINGDGTDEALAFFRGQNSLLKINVYAPVGGEYRLVLTLQEEGRSIGSVALADMDRDGARDMIVAWQIASGMSILSVYSLENWSGRLLMSTDCTEFVTGDLDQDGYDELLVIRAANAGTYLVDMYTLGTDGEPQAATAALSAGINQLSRSGTVQIGGGQTALLVESFLAGGDLVTDLLVWRDSALVNLTMNRSTGVSETRRSNDHIFSQDIDGDGAVEIPHSQQLYNQGNDLHWSTAWFRYDISGRATQVMTTYHDVSDGWYLVLPNGWDVGLTVRRDDSVPGERAVILSRLGSDGNINDLMAIYATGGENRSDRARLPGRFVLEESSSTVFSAKIFGDSIDRNGVESRFHIIYAEWGSGSV